MLKRPLIIAGILLVVVGGAAPAGAEDNPAATPALPTASGAEVLEQAQALFDPQPTARTAAIRWLVDQGSRDAMPALIQALRFNPSNHDAIVEALTVLAGTNAGDGWFDWMLWQQAHPEIVAFAGFDVFKADLMARIDPAFRVFLYPGVAHDIRLEEIAWGGVLKDGIPALTNPTLIAADAATYLAASDLVFGIAINGDARAYPLRIMNWHEMFNDVIGGVPVSLAYCTLCGSGILFETKTEDRAKPFIFGSSGFLYRSNKLMYDEGTYSLWNQFTGRPVVGKLTGSGIELKTRPVVITTWDDWRRTHPDTRVLSLDTGHARDYSEGAAYGSYFGSPDLMFPALVDEASLKAKDYVFALRGAGLEKAWPLSLFERSGVINDSAGTLSLTLIGDPATRSVRAYATDGQAFRTADAANTLLLGDDIWRISEDALVGPRGEELHRLPGHIAYWFAWSGYFGDRGEVASPAN
jgi:Protein of unknown function (DUF3179)